MIDEPWKSFEFNRSHALAELRKILDVDYAFIIDADNSIEIDPNLDLDEMKRSLDRDIYSIAISLGGVAYRRNQLCRNNIAFRYRGVLHEFLEPPSPEATTGHLDGVKMTARVEGARSKSAGKYLNDAKILKEALEREIDVFMRSRYTFYLAQSYRDGGEKELALKYFLSRAGQGFWAEEVFMSLFSAAGLMQELGRSVDEVVKVYLRASDVAPNRAEGLHAAARLLREKDRFEQAYQLAKRGEKIPKPENGLFVQGWVYDYGLSDELSVSAYWTGRFEECLRLSTALLESQAVPQGMIPRVGANAEFARQKLSTKGVMPEDDETALKPLADIDLPDLTAADGQAPVVTIFKKQTKIVRTIHVVWIGEENKRPDNCIHTWRDQNPDWRVAVWGKNELRSIRWRNAHHMRAMLGRELSGVADMMRWEILHQHGGFAIDADAVCVRPLEDWLFEPELFASWEDEIARPGVIANGFVYAQRGNPLIGRVIDEIYQSPNMADGMARELTGAARLTETVQKYRCADITIYPSHFFTPVHLTGATYAGTGPIFAKQFWGGTLPETYESLSTKSVSAL